MILSRRLKTLISNGYWTRRKKNKIHLFQKKSLLKSLLKHLTSTASKISFCCLQIRHWFLASIESVLLCSTQIVFYDLNFPWVTSTWETNVSLTSPIFIVIFLEIPSFDRTEPFRRILNTWLLVPYTFPSDVGPDAKYKSKIPVKIWPRNFRLF